MSDHVDGRTLQWPLRPRAVTAWLLLIAAGLVVMHLVTKILGGAVLAGAGGNAAYIYWIEPFFDMARGGNLPAFFSTLIKLLAAGLFLLIAADEHRGSRQVGAAYWVILGVGCLLLSLDEATSMHNTVITPILNHYVGGTAIEAQGWFLLYVPVLLVTALAYVPFLRRLTPVHRRWLIFGGLVGVFGGVGVEGIESMLTVRSAPDDWVVVMILVEETLEMIGVIVVNYALLRYLADYGIQLRLGRSGPAPTP